MNFSYNYADSFQTSSRYEPSTTLNEDLVKIPKVIINFRVSRRRWCWSQSTPSRTFARIATYWLRRRGLRNNLQWPGKGRWRIRLQDLLLVGNCKCEKCEKIGKDQTLLNTSGLELARKSNSSIIDVCVCLGWGFYSDEWNQTYF